MTQTSPPLWKQLLGAGVGAVVALAVYGVYEGVVPSIEAYLVPKDTLNKETLANRRYVPPQTQVRFNRIAQKTRAMVERFESERDVRALEEELTEMVLKDKDTSPEVVTQESFPVETVEETSVSEMPLTTSPVTGALSGAEEISPSLPQSGIGLTMGILAASAGGLVTLWRKKST